VVETENEIIETDDLGDGWVSYIIREHTPLGTRYSIQVDYKHEGQSLVYYGPVSRYEETIRRIKPVAIEKAKSAYTGSEFTLVDARDYLVD